MEIEIVRLGLIQTNCYLIKTDKAAVVIDPGFERENVLKFLKDNADKQRLILLTHGHFDHIGGAALLRKQTGTKIGIGKLDAPALSDKSLNLADKFRMNLEPFSPDYTYEEGDEIVVGDIVFKVIFTPGHTVGGVSYLSGNCLFSGDTLFNCSVGRTDFPGGDVKWLQNSIGKLFDLPDNTEVYPGHGEITTIGFERENNMFVW